MKNEPVNENSQHMLTRTKKKKCNLLSSFKKKSSLQCLFYREPSLEIIFIFTSKYFTYHTFQTFHRFFFSSVGKEKLTCVSGSTECVRVNDRKRKLNSSFPRLDELASYRRAFFSTCAQSTYKYERISVCFKGQGCRMVTEGLDYNPCCNPPGMNHDSSQASRSLKQPPSPSSS